jgi:hypothetical protein
MRSGWTSREADDVSSLQGVLPIRGTQHERAVDDKQPFLFVLIVIRGLALTGQVVDEHQSRARSHGASHVHPASAFSALKMFTVSIQSSLPASKDSAANPLAGVYP